MLVPWLKDPSAFRSSNEISRLQGARHGRHHDELSCTENLPSPFFMRLDIGVSQRGSMFFSCLKRLTHFQLSQFQHLSNYKPSWQQRKSFNMPSKPPLPQNPEPFGIVARLQEWALTKQEMARKTWGCKRANPKNTGSFFLLGGSWLLIFILPIAEKRIVRCPKVIIANLKCKKIVCGSEFSSYPRFFGILSHLTSKDDQTDFCWKSSIKNFRVKRRCVKPGAGYLV